MIRPRGDTRRSARHAGTRRDDAPRRARRGTTRLPAGLRSRRSRSPGFVSRSRAWWKLRQLDDRTERAREGELNRVLFGSTAGRPDMPSIGSSSSSRTPRTRARCRCSRRSGSRRSHPELWRFLLAIDGSKRSVRPAPRRPPLFLLVERPNRLDSEGLRRPVASARGRGTALAARAAASGGRVTLDVARIRSCPTTSGWTVEAGAARRSRRRPDVRLDVQALAAAYLGGFTFADLAAPAGRRGRAGRYARADAM